MGFLIYFFSVQCPDCGYISFKQEKDCGSCGFSLKKATTSSASLFRNNSFNIFISSKAHKKKQDESCPSSSQAHEKIAVIEASKGSQLNRELTSRDFLLNLSDAKQDHSGPNLKSDSSELNTRGFSPIKFYNDIDLQEVKQTNPELMSKDFLLNLSDAKQDHSGPNLKSDSSELNTRGFSPIKFYNDIDLQKVEELELELAPFEKEPPTSATAKTEHEETQIEVSENQETVDLRLKNTGLKSNYLDDILSSKEVELDKAGRKLEITLPSSQSIEKDLAEPMAPILDLRDTEILLGLEPESPTEESSPPLDQLNELNIENYLDDILSTEEVELEKSVKKCELTLPLSQNIEKDLEEPMPPILDLGDTEILLGLELESPNEESSPPLSQLEELKINRVTDNSEEALVISDDEIPEVKIEDLSLDLEDSDSPADPQNPRPWYPFLNRKTGF